MKLTAGMGHKAAAVGRAMVTIALASLLTGPLTSSIHADHKGKPHGGGGGGNNGGGSDDGDATKTSVDLCVIVPSAGGSITGDGIVVNDVPGMYCDNKKEKINAVIGDKKTGFNINTNANRDQSGRSMTVDLLLEQQTGNNLLDFDITVTTPFFILRILDANGNDFNYEDFQAIGLNETIDVLVWARFDTTDGVVDPFWLLEFGYVGTNMPQLTKISEFAVDENGEVVSYDEFTLTVDSNVTAQLFLAGGDPDSFAGDYSVPFTLTAQDKGKP